MNFTIAKDKLAFLLQTVLKAVPTKTSMSNIKGCLIEATSDNIILSGTNLDWGVKISQDAGILSSGSVMVSGRILDDIVKTMSTGDITLSLDESAWSLSVTSGSSHMVLNALPPNDFPKWPEPSGTGQITIPVQSFQDLVRSGATSAVNNPARPLWGACLIEIKDNFLNVVSTDQFALSRARMKIEAQEQKAIVPADILQDISKLCLSTSSKDVLVEIAENQVYFSSGEMSAFSRLIQGQYYAYEQVIPKSFTSEAIVPTSLLLGATQRASIVAGEEDKAMRIILDSQKEAVHIKAGSPEKGKMEETLPCSIKGESLEVWMQYKYVLQALSRITAEEVFIGVQGQVKPLKIEPIHKEKPKVEEVFVIMPMSPKGAF